MRILATCVLLFCCYHLSGQGFIQNLGQWDERVNYRAESDGGMVYLEDDGFTYMFWDRQKFADRHGKPDPVEPIPVDYHAVKFQFEGANPSPRISERYLNETPYSYFIGNNPDKWASGARACSELLYHDFYPGIDLKIKLNGPGFKYSLIVHPGADPSVIKASVLGADDLFIDQGRLKVLTSLTAITEDAPYTFQYQDGEMKEIESAYILDGREVRFALGNYDKEDELIIDPSVIFSSLSLSTVDNWGYTATYDHAGNGITGGTVYGQGYPTTTGAFQRFFGGGPSNDQLARDCGIYKLSDDGTTLLFMTYLGGNNNEQPHSLVATSRDNIVIYGTTESPNFPTPNGFQRVKGDTTDIFVALLSVNGRNLLSATFLGGDDADGLNGNYNSNTLGPYRNRNALVYNYGDLYRGEVVVDSNDYVYVASTTLSRNFPVKNGYRTLYQGGGQDAVLVKLEPDLSAMSWGTFLGGNDIDAAYSLSFDKDNHIYVTGGTKGGNFPTTSGAYKTTYQGGWADAFLLRLSSDGQTLDYSTLFGSSQYDQSFFVKVGPEDRPWVFGQSEGNFPTVGTSNNASRGVFIAKFKKDLSDISLSRVIGANNLVNISPSAFSVDLCGRVYFSGWGGLDANDNTTGNTSGLGTTSDAEKTTTEGRDFYMAVYTKDLASPIYATFFGGNDGAFNSSSEHVDGGTSRFDRRGIIYQAICAACNGGQSTPVASRFPTFPSNVYGPSSRHSSAVNCNNAIVKIDLEGPALFAEFDVSDISCKVPQTLDFTNLTEKSTSFNWDMGDGTTYTDSNVTHTYDEPGVYRVRLIAYNPISCNLRDTQYATIRIYARSEADFEPDIDICTKEVSFTHLGDYARTFNWSFGDGNVSDEKNPVHQYRDTGTFAIRLFTDIGTDCADTFEIDITLEDPFNDFDVVLDTCEKTVQTTNFSTGFDSLIWEFGDASISTDFEPDHSYNARGEYRLVLRTNIGLSCEDSTVTDIDIREPEADFSYEIDTCSGEVIITNNSIDAVRHRWEYEGGVPITQDTPVIRFPVRDSTYRLLLIAAPFSSCRDSQEQLIDLPDLPKAAFTYRNDTCVSGAWFTNLSTNSPSYLWFYGNGDSSRKDSPFYNYRDTGTFKVQLIAYPYSDCPDTATEDITIDTFRFADFNTLLDTCRFTAELLNTSEDLDSFYWTLGDGNELGTREGIHQYDSSGTYLIRLFGLKTLNDCRDSIEYFLEIPELPTAAYRDSTDSCLNTKIFIDRSINTIDRRWYASTGDSGRMRQFRVEFPREGDYTVTLVAISEYGCEDSLIIPVIIDSIPVARFSIELDSCIGGARLLNNSFGDFRIKWLVNNNMLNEADSPFVNFTEVGIRYAQLIINQGSECADTIEKELDISEYTVDNIQMGNVFTPNGDGKNDVFKVLNLRPDCDDYELIIYNRWGKEVFHGKGNTLEWDGTNGREFALGSDIPMAAGLYFYIFKSNYFTRQGTITLLR